VDCTTFECTAGDLKNLFAIMSNISGWKNWPGAITKRPIGYRNPNLYWPPDVLYRAVEEYKREAQMRLPLKQAAYDVAHNGTRYGRGGHRPPRR
jgi:hypothetical protein